MTILRDLRFAVRLLWKDRWFTAAAVAALALGIGANTTVFTFVNAVLIRGLPFPDADRILHIGGRNPVRDQNMAVSYPDFQDLAREVKSFESLGAWTGFAASLSESGVLPERYNGTSVSANAFGILRQPPLLGRDFRPEEDKPGAEPVMIIGYAVWQTRYGGDPTVLGRVVRVNDVPTTIIGVMPQGMRFPMESDAWRPLVPAEPQQRRDNRGMQVFGRMKPGVTREQATAELAGLASGLAKQYPDTNKDVTTRVSTFNQAFNGGNIRLVFLSLMGAVTFVLLIACANVANLLLSRSVQRAREVAVRVALGASRARIMRQLLVESVLLAALGGIIGLGFAAIGARLFEQATADVGKPFWIRFTLDWQVVAFFAMVCVVTGILFGLAPAFQVSRTNVNDVLKEGGRGNAGGVRARRFTQVMVVFQIALTLVLLTGAGLMVRSFLKLYQFDLGITRTSELMTMRFNLIERKYPNADARRRFYERLSEHLSNVPGTHAVTYVSNPPNNGGWGRTLEIDGKAAAKSDRPPRVTTLFVGDRYFETLQLTMRRGREFGPRDGTTGAETVIVNERFAARFMPGEELIGRRIRLAVSEKEIGPWLTIIGVSPTVRQASMQDVEPDPVVYLPYRLEPVDFSTIVARGPGEPSALTAPLRRAIQEVDPDLSVADVRTFDAVLARQRWPYAIFGTLFGIFAFIALLLSSVGIYAVMAYSVSQRRQEIGIRMALGAGAGRVAFSVLRGGLVQLTIGLLLGLAGGYGVSQLLSSLVVQMSPTDPLTFIAIVALLTAVTVSACLIPARRASRVDPLVALRAD